MKLKAVSRIGLTVLLVSMLTVVVLPITVSGGVVDVDAESEDFVTQSGVDWWPMFRHDLNHTGYSTSTAPNTNNTIWSYTTGGDVGSSPAVVDGKVYVGSYDGRIYCLNALTGAFIWNYTTATWVGHSSPAVADGIVYVGSGDHKVYAFGAPEPAVPVGGIYIPVNKLELLAPYIGLTMLLAVAVMTVVYVKKRKRNTEINS